MQKTRPFDPKELRAGPLAGGGIIAFGILCCTLAMGLVLAVAITAG